MSVCGACGKHDDDGAPLKQCSRCEAAYYCSAECQRRVWKEHKRVCKAPSSSSEVVPYDADSLCEVIRVELGRQIKDPADQRLRQSFAAPFLANPTTAVAISILVDSLDEARDLLAPGERKVIHKMAMIDARHPNSKQLIERIVHQTPPLCRMKPPYKWAAEGGAREQMAFCIEVKDHAKASYATTAFAVGLVDPKFDPVEE